MSNCTHPRGAMCTVHPVWVIAEVVRELMEQCRDNKETLASCVVGELDGMHALYSILRTSIKTIWTQHKGINVMQHVIRGPIADGEWARSQFYANLVRVLTRSDDQERVDAVTSATLLLKNQGQPLLPRLTKLYYVVEDEYSSDLLLFMSPTLRDVSVGVRGLASLYPPKQEPHADEYSSAAVLQIVHAVAPHLQLALKFVKDPSAVHLVCHSLPLLQRLDVYYAHAFRAERFQPLPTHLPDLHLGSITSLKLSGNSDWTALTLEAIRTHRLRRIVVSVELVDDIPARCIGTIATRLAHAGPLSALTLDLDDNDLNMQPRVFHDLVAPLYAVRTLREVSFDVCFETPVVVTAEDLENIARAWPDLQHLGLRYSRPHDVYESAAYALPPVPITALEHLARGCPQLAMLVIDMPDSAPLEGMDLDAVPTYVNLLRRAHLWSPLPPHLPKA
ncbi:hypothetical protein C8Q76DRAFT_695975 [Earliella scabrosa]|nr:hypothetical protein C8Q76DRAFT_695975 [Earliella scabrosa]